MRNTIQVFALLLLCGCHSSSESERVSQVADPPAATVQTISFVGRITQLERAVQYRSVPWVGTFVSGDGKRKRFVIGARDHELFKRMGLDGTGKIENTTDFSTQPTFHLKGRSCPIDGVWELTSWEQVKK